MKTKLKNGFKKVKKWIKKHKVLTVFLILAAVVVLFWSSRYWVFYGDES